MRRKNEVVLDIPTNTLTKIVGVRDVVIDGKKVDMYIVDDNVPLTADYPTRWRNPFEVKAPAYKKGCNNL